MDEILQYDAVQIVGRPRVESNSTKPTSFPRLVFCLAFLGPKGNIIVVVITAMMNMSRIMMRTMTSQSAATTRALCVRVSFAACPKAPPLCTHEQRILHTACNTVDTTHSKLHRVKTTQRAQHTAHYPKLHNAQMAVHIAHYEQWPVSTLYS